MILGLSGYAGAGKDEFARRLVDGHGWRRVSFADKVRAFLYALDPTVHSMDGARPLSEVVDAVGWQQAKQMPEVRGLLQRLGVDAARRTLGNDVWVNAALGGLEPGRYVVTDVRFVNEAQAIVDRGGKIARVARPGCGPVNGHRSETEMDEWPWDLTIPNAGTVDDLHEQADRLARILA